MPLRQYAVSLNTRFPVIDWRCSEIDFRASRSKPLAASNGWVNGDWQSVSLYSDGRYYKLNIGDGVDFLIDYDRGVICAANSGLDLDQEKSQSLLVGLPLILVLSATGTWLMHASGVVANGLSAIFLGQSGAGKSTFAAACISHANCQRLSDDILPLAWLDQRCLVLPRYPQFKLPPEQQRLNDNEQNHVLDAVYILERSAQPDTRIQIRSLSASQSILRIVRHTVASRLFHPQLLIQHLTFCKNLAQTVTVKVCRYPSDLDQLPQVVDSVIDDLTMQTKLKNWY